MQRRLKYMDIREILRRLREQHSDRRIAKDLNINRRTVQRYRDWAIAEKLLTGELPDHQTLMARLPAEQTPPQNASSVEPYRASVEQWIKEHVRISAIHERLKERGYGGSYASVLRLARQIDPKTQEAVTRVECQPGEEAQVDFGYVGMMLDAEGKLRKTWSFVMVLSWSRHAYVEFVTDQTIATWLTCHRHALEYFGGVPARIVIDNLKAGITRAVWDEPQLQMAYRECAEHYGFLVHPCRPHTPQHKGKVERGVDYVEGNFLGGRGEMSLSQANLEVRAWCLGAAGNRIHGTTKERPLERFSQVERSRLKPLPAEAYDLAIWSKNKLHRDCHLVFEGSYYSAPFRFLGQSLWICAGTRQVRIYNDKYELVATHERATKPGERQTHRDHLPPEKLPGLERNRPALLEQAAQIGPATQKLVETLLAETGLDQLHPMGRLLRLQEKFTPERLEAACQRAIDYDDLSYKTVKRILTKNLENLPIAPIPVEIPTARTFVRQPAEIVGALAEVFTWN
jgi:transposase